MNDNKVPKLRVSRAEATEQIRSQINKGKELHETQINSEQEFDKLKSKTWKWVDYNKMLFRTLFDESPLSEYHGSTFLGIIGQNLGEEMISHKDNISGWINDLESIYEQLGLYEELPNNTQQPMNNDAVNNENKKIFIGHGGSHIWRELKDFIEDTLNLSCEEFNRIPAAGKSTSDRLKEMLEVSCMAFLIMTGEDEQADGSLRARENVVHEVGLFQGRLGFEKAIILLEDDCEDFSNIHGITHIPFPKGKINTTFGEIIRVLQRENIKGEPV